MGAIDQVLGDPDLEAEFARLPAQQQAIINWQLGWLQKAHKHQIEPPVAVVNRLIYPVGVMRQLLIGRTWAIV